MKAYSQEEFLLFKKKISSGEKIDIRIMSGSMKPLIQTNEKIVISNFEELRLYLHFRLVKRGIGRLYLGGVLKCVLLILWKLSRLSE